MNDAFWAVMSEYGYTLDDIEPKPSNDDATREGGQNETL